MTTPRQVGLEDLLSGLHGQHRGSLVYPTTAGASTTATGGASMVNCDTDNDTNPVPPVGVDLNGLCRTDHATTQAQFLTGKGLAVTDFGTATTARHTF